MTAVQDKRGAAPVGYLAELDPVEVTSVIYLRLWSDGGDGHAQMRCEFSAILGTDQGARALQSFEALCAACAAHGRRPLMRHSIGCKCLGADEACFAHFIATAADGDRDDAMLMATLLVRVDMAPVVASLATDVGLAFKRMRLRSQRAVDQPRIPEHRILH